MQRVGRSSVVHAAGGEGVLLSKVGSVQAGGVNVKGGSRGRKGSGAFGPKSERS